MSRKNKIVPIAKAESSLSATFFSRFFHLTDRPLTSTDRPLNLFFPVLGLFQHRFSFIRLKINFT